MFLSTWAVQDVGTYLLVAVVLASLVVDRRAFPNLVGDVRYTAVFITKLLYNVLGRWQTDVLLGNVSNTTEC